ncbi:hypothetical protein [Streptomyces violaceus]|uniref:Uncharacterized protein n=1 Tax=Streptomyces violaceus TaxID=1936 RepID=A0ABY9UTI7_STRVL|nr:hypothetical protein [Streptomyces janthinus]WND24157.1 hypothetical protein RI060_43330 [Streptomyces janthinus]GGS96804.1 hypothetical protein GCM10010270_80960 [Streptomyces janthinus]
MTTTVTARPDAAAARQADAQVGRMVGKAIRLAKQQPEPRPPVPYEHHVLFREPTYEDGKPYADDGEDDEPAIITP